VKHILNESLLNTQRAFFIFVSFMKLPKDFYLNDDVITLSKKLLGKRLCTYKNGIYTSAIICETEAYAGIHDKASHAYGNRRTKRTESMYQSGGIAYVYLCYGIHHLFNVVTNQAGVPHAVLIRGAYAEKGLEHILSRRNQQKASKQLLIGPGKLSQGLGITTIDDQMDLCGNEIWIEESEYKISSKEIKTSPRIGVDYAEEDASLPYRFEYDL
jgi:DNA-3-methyladenine glycosylase